MSLEQVTLRLLPAVMAAIGRQANDAGLDVADYMSAVLSRHAMPSMDDTIEVRRLEAELSVKDQAVAIARRISPMDAFDDDVTLKVFQEIKADQELLARYQRSISAPDGSVDRKRRARINRTLGSTICAAVNGRAKKTNGGKPITAYVTDELIRSYTPLSR